MLRVCAAKRTCRGRNLECSANDCSLEFRQVSIQARAASSGTAAGLTMAPNAGKQVGQLGLLAAAFLTGRWTHSAGTGSARAELSDVAPEERHLLYTPHNPKPNPNPRSAICSICHRLTTALTLSLSLTLSLTLTRSATCSTHRRPATAQWRCLPPPPPSCVTRAARYTTCASARRASTCCPALRVRCAAATCTARASSTWSAAVLTRTSRTYVPGPP